MLTTDQARRVLGGTVVGSDGSELGKIGQVFLDDRTGEPEWLTVNTGLFGTRESFVPLAEASVEDDTVRVPYSKQQVQDAPNVDADLGHLDAEEEVALYRHYGLRYAEDQSEQSEQSDQSEQSEQPEQPEQSEQSRHGTPAPRADDAMTRSEERLHTGVERVVGRKARLRKWVETEVIQVPVTVRREKARLETVPVTESEAAGQDVVLPGSASSDGTRPGAPRGTGADRDLVAGDQPEVVLWEERPVITTETVPVERVRLVTETVQEEATVAEQLRKEQVTLEEDVVDVNDADGSPRT